MKSAHNYLHYKINFYSLPFGNSVCGNFVRSENLSFDKLSGRGSNRQAVPGCMGLGESCPIPGCRLGELSEFVILRFSSFTTNPSAFVLPQMPTPASIVVTFHSDQFKKKNGAEKSIKNCCANSHNFGPENSIWEVVMVAGKFPWTSEDY